MDPLLQTAVLECMSNAQFALDVVFNCSVKETASEIGSQIGFDTLEHWPLLKHIGLFNLQETPDVRANVIIGMRDQFEAVGLHWNDITADHIVSNAELLQAKMLEVYNAIPAETFAGLKPGPTHVEAAQATTNLYGITAENYSDLPISEKIKSFADFEKLLAAMNYVYGDLSASQAAAAKEQLAAASIQQASLN